MLIHSRNIYVYETDLMGIVHHSNYLRFCEEARIEWCKRFLKAEGENSKDFLHKNVYSLTVVETKVQHKRPLMYPNKFSIEIRSQIDGIKLIYQYKIKNIDSEICALVETIHCSVNEKLKPIRLSAELIAAVNMESDQKIN